MPNSPFERRRAGRKPLPQCKAFLTCSEVAVDDVTGRFSLQRIINTLDFAEFPAETQPIMIYLQLYDGIGRYELSLELRNLTSDNRVGAEILSHLEFPERLAKMELVLPIDSIRLPGPGRYEIAILFDGLEAATQFIDAEVADGGET